MNEWKISIVRDRSRFCVLSRHFAGRYPRETRSFRYQSTRIPSHSFPSIEFTAFLGLAEFGIRANVSFCSHFRLRYRKERSRASRSYCLRHRRRNRVVARRTERNESSSLPNSMEPSEIHQGHPLFDGELFERTLHSQLFASLLSNARVALVVPDAEFVAVVAGHSGCDKSWKKCGRVFSEFVFGSCVVHSGVHTTPSLCFVFYHRKTHSTSHISLQTG